MKGAAPLGNEARGGLRGGVHASTIAHRPPAYECGLKGGSGAWSSTGSPAGLLSSMFRLAQEEQISRPYIQSQIIYSCVQVRSRALASIGQQWWVDEVAGRTVEDSGGAQGREFLRLMARPNPLMSARKFWKQLETFYCLAGGAFLFLSKAEGGRLRPIAPNEMPDSIWPVREDLVSPKFSTENRNTLPDSWAFEVSDGEEVYPAHAVAHLYEADPYNILRGIGPMQAAFRRANVAFKVEAFDDALVANGGQLGGVLIPKTNLTSDQRKMLSQSWHQNQERAVNHRRTAILPTDFTYQSTAMTPVDMDFAAMRAWSREEIMMVFGVTKPLLGITDDVNRANAYVARRVFYESTVLPQTEFWSDEVSGSLMSKLPAWAQQWTHQFLTDHIAALREQLDSVIDRVEKLMKLGRSFEEAARLSGWDIDAADMPGVQERYLMSSLVPADLAGIGQPPKSQAREEDKANARGLPFRVYASGLTRGERVQKSTQFERFLKPWEDKVARSAKKVMRGYMLATRARIKALAKGNKDDGQDHVEPIRPWTWISRDLDAYGRPTWDDEDPRIEVRNITAAELDRILSENVEEWGRTLWAEVKDPITGTYRAAAADMAGILGVDVFPATESPAFLKFMSRKEVLLVEGPMGTLREQVKRQIVETMSDPNLTGTLGDRIREVLEELNDQVTAMTNRLGTRAELIARTETASAANAANMEQMKEAEITEHEWLSSGDDLVRTEPVRHDIDGEVVIIGEPFSNGLHYPGDSEHARDAGAVAMCRCRTLPIIPRT